MRIPRGLKTALSVVRGPHAPYNLFGMPLAEVEALGFKKVDGMKTNYEDNDLICAATNAKDLWIWLDNAACLRKGLKCKEIGDKMIVYRR